MAHKIDKLNNNLTPPSSPSVRRSSHLWRDMMGVLRRKDSTAAASSNSTAAFANAINNNRISCPTGGMSAQRSPSISILRHHRYYYSEVSVCRMENWKFIFILFNIFTLYLCCTRYVCREMRWDWKLTNRTAEPGTKHWRSHGSIKLSEMIAHRINGFTGGK